MPEFRSGAAILESSVAFEGFVRAGGVDVTEDGVLGMLCAKYWHPWVESLGPLPEAWHVGS